MKHRLLPKKCELYHGKEKTRPYFEGWYFKHVSKDGNFAMSVICGVSRSENEKDDHSFVQIITGPVHQSRYVSYPYSAFEYDREKFAVSVGENTFSYNGIHLDIDSEDIKLKADLTYSAHMYLKADILSPSIMGPFSYIPNMECNHGVLSLRNRVDGAVTLNGETYDMQHSAGYIEKDWGEAFPSAWIWLQGNFSAGKDDTAFMCSVASIPFGLLNFTGLICVLSAGGEQYRFATYNGARILSVMSFTNGVDIILKRGALKLFIKARAESFDNLIGPTRNGMDRTLYESIAGQIELKLYKKGELIVKTELFGCGMEVSEIGDLVK